MRPTRSSYLALPAILCLLAACQDPAADKPKARVAEPAATVAPSAAPAAPAETGAAPAPAAAPGAGALPLSPETSRIGFVGSKVTGSHEGQFHRFSGSIELRDGAPEGGKVTVEIDMDSVEADRERLTGHLKSADFFDVAVFPKARFESTEVRAGAEGGEETGATHTITGNLTLHGVSKQISFPATITAGETEVQAKSEFSINRRDFGINYDGKADDLIRDGVVIQLDIRAPRAG